jgi:diguanylate cyclase (GGDEF)-like protein
MMKKLLNIFSQKSEELAPQNTAHGTQQYLPIFIDRINQSLTSLTYNQANVGLFTGLVCASIIWYRVHNNSAVVYLNAWYVLIILSTLARAVLVRIYSLKNKPESDVKFWRKLFFIGSTMGGICWGLISFFILPYVSPLNEILILMILAGITAGAVAFVAGILAAACSFLITALLPIAIYFIYVKAVPDYLTGVTVAVYLLFLINQASKIHSMLQNGLLLQFELNEAKDQLEQTATHDPLTKVANRHLFNTKLTQAINLAKADNSKIALIYLDLNKFKLINDIYGHHTGDEILLIFVERLKSLFKEKDMISRLGGDEFTVVIDKLSKYKSIDAIAAEIHRVLEAPAYVHGQRIDIRASLGISIYPSDGLDPETLLRVADSKMYTVKRALS